MPKQPDNDEPEDDGNESEEELGVQWIQNLETNLTKKIERQFQTLSEKIEGLVPKTPEQPPKSEPTQPIPALTPETVKQMIDESLADIRAALEPKKKPPLFRKKHR